MSEEYETAKKKRQALDGLLDKGKISQSTHDLFAMEIAETITDVERQQKALLQKMNTKIIELKEQIKTLEILLANFEIQHVTGEVDNEVYERQINVLSMGLETSKQELETIKEASEQLATGNVVTEVEIEQEPTEEKHEKPAMEYAEVVETSPSATEQATSETSEEPQPIEIATESEEKQEA